MQLTILVIRTIPIEIRSCGSGWQDEETKIERSKREFVLWCRCRLQCCLLLDWPELQKLL